MTWPWIYIRERRQAKAWEQRRQLERPVEQLAKEAEMWLAHPEPTQLPSWPDVEISPRRPEASS